MEICNAVIRIKRDKLWEILNKWYKNKEGRKGGKREEGGRRKAGKKRGGERSHGSGSGVFC